MRKVFLRTVYFFSLVATALLLQRCAADEDALVLLRDHEYLPLAKGYYWEYQITETIYTNGPEGDAAAYQLRMEVMDSIPHTSGYYSYIVYRSTRSVAGTAWQYQDTWTVTFTDREAIVQQGNISFVKLALPIEEGISWDGNAYNTLGSEDYTITRRGDSFLNADLSLPDVVEVTHRDETDAIVGNDVRKEIYARGVGLVQRTEETITYCSNATTCIGQQQIETGVIRQQVLQAYGKN
jgi:hypothetical protein